jgi:hypothetical protein
MCGLCIAGRHGDTAGSDTKRASAQRAVAALALLLAVAPHAWGASDCQLAFEKWATLSGAKLRIVPRVENNSTDGRGACVPSEAVRKELLDELTLTSAQCAEPSSDQSLQQTRTLLNINQSFIASLAVCRDTRPDFGNGWVTNSRATAAKPLTPNRPPTPPCLEISPTKQEYYALINRRCHGHAVLAVIETGAAAGGITCKGYTISESLSVRTARNMPPRINHECILNEGPCNNDHLGSMFPECDW